MLSILLHEAGAAVRIDLPLARVAYQTNEVIDLAVVRTAAAELTPGDLQLTLSDGAGSRLDFTLPVSGQGQSRVEHIKLNARLLRPGDYTLSVSVDGERAETAIAVHSHVRRSEYRLVNWGGSGENKDARQWSQGEDNLGFNLMLAHYPPYSDFLIRAGVDYMRCCTMSGGHQMDLRSECDWSDPYVIHGGRRRMSRQAFIDRTRSNVIGVHAYDEPGLTWREDPETGKWTPHMIPAQVRSFSSAFDRQPLSYLQVDPAKAEDRNEWRHWARWKLGFMDAAWQDAQFGVSYTRPDFMTLTQSQYGFSAFTDGYYFNVVRSLPVTCGHGGYHDWGPGYFNPSLTLELARARDWSKPCWYLPTWYGNTSADLFRLEQYLSFQTNIQGLMTPPPLDPFAPERNPAAVGIVESNKVAARLGPIFNHLPVTRPPVAMLYSLSHMIQNQTQDMNANYAHAEAHGANCYYTYLAGKLMQQQFMPVLDEDVVDGTLAAQHRAVILTSIDYLDDNVRTALAAFAADGGLVLKTADSEVEIAGAVDLGLTPGLPEANRRRLEAIETELKKPGLDAAAGTALAAEKQALSAMRGALQGAKLLAAAIQPHLQQAGIEPVFRCDEEGIVATRQASGDVEYLFAVNAKHDYQGDPQLGLMAADATITIAADGRPVYDALLGVPATAFAKAGDALTAKLRFGPGAMRVWARTARPIGAVRVGTSLLQTDFSNTEAPIRLAVTATLLDSSGGLLVGAVPLRIRVTDALGTVRYDLYRATDDGVCRVALPLAANDAAGAWTVAVQELLAGSEDHATFSFSPPKHCAALAGSVRRAVVFRHDQKNIFRFFRLHQDVTIVVGASDYNGPAAERLARILEPWNVRCQIISAADANKSRTLSETEAATWVGLGYRGKGQIKAGDENPPDVSGFVVRGPVLLLGTPEDNPLIAFAAQQGFLPYAPAKGVFPGPGRGYLAWQFDAVGVGQESVTLIADDDAGMSEAVGSLYEAAAGLDPLTSWSLPASNTIVPASQAVAVPSGTIAWQAVLNDRIDALTVDGDVIAVTHDGSIARISAAGAIQANAPDAEAGQRAQEILAQEPKIDAAAQTAYAPQGRLLKKLARNEGRTAAACWGGYLQVVDSEGKVLVAHQFGHDIGGLGWLGDVVVVGLSDGRVAGLSW